MVHITKPFLRHCPAIVVFAALFGLVGCEKLDSFTTTEDAKISDRPRIDLPMRTDDEEDEEPVAVAVAPTPDPEPEPLEPLPPIVLPPALIGGVTECAVDGVIFRATECYRTGRGFRLTVYCGSNEKDATIIFSPGQCLVVGGPSMQQSGLAIMEGPFVQERIELPRGQVMWFQLEPPRMPIEDTTFTSVSIAFDSQSTIKTPVEFLGVPVTGEELPNLPLDETTLVPERLERMLASGLMCQTVWRFGDFLGDTILHVESFDPETRAIAGRFYDAEDRNLVKHFEGSLAPDGMTFEVKTVRGDGIRTSGTTEISNTNLYLAQQETHVTFHLMRTDLLGVSQDGVAFCARIPAQVAY